MRQLILLRGMPGSGKSTFAKHLARSNCYYNHYEADMYFMDNGEYKFDASKLGAAHKWCLDESYGSLRDGRPVIVSNTFTTSKELRPYFDLTKEFGFVPTVILMQNQFGSIHNVPVETIERMKARFDYDLSSLYA